MNKIEEIIKRYKEAIYREVPIDYVVKIEIVPEYMVYNSINAENIVTIISEYLNISMEEIKGDRRYRNIIIARQICCYFLKLYTNLSLYNIGEVLGNKHHSTVIHAIKAIKTDLEMNYGNIEDIVEQIHYKIKIANISIENYESIKDNIYSEYYRYANKKGINKGDITKKDNIDIFINWLRNYIPENPRVEKIIEEIDIELRNKKKKTDNTLNFILL